jgi:hypothetical protein
MQMDQHCYNTDTFILLTATAKPTAINENVLLRFHGNNDYANAPQYNVVRTYCDLLKHYRIKRSKG